MKNATVSSRENKMGIQNFFRIKEEENPKNSFRQAWPDALVRSGIGLNRAIISS